MSPVVSRWPEVPRCSLCGGVLNWDRQGSQLDWLCNRLVNPGDSNGAGYFRPVEGEWATYENRVGWVKGLHFLLRGLEGTRTARAGWGRISLTDLEHRLPWNPANQREKALTR